jgi:hypothetical protein
VNDEIEHVIAGNIQAMDAVVQGKREVARNSRNEGLSEIRPDVLEFQYLQRLEEIAKRLNGGILNDIGLIVEYELGLKGVRINQEPDDAYAQEVNIDSVGAVSLHSCLNRSCSRHRRVRRCGSDESTDPAETGIFLAQNTTRTS